MSISLATRVRAFVGPLIATPAVGRLVARAFRNRIRHRGLTIDTSSPLVTDAIKAALFWQGYESGEYRFARRYVPRDVDVIELGGSLGVITCTLCRHVAPDRKVVTLEADPRIAEVLERNIALNGCADKANVVAKAIHYGEGKTVSFGIGESTVAGRIGDSAAGLRKLDVPATTLAAVIAEAGVARYAVVSDIEGIEWQVLEHDRAALLGARVIIMELHDGPQNQPWTELADRLRADPDFDMLDQHGSVVVLRPKAFA